MEFKASISHNQIMKESTMHEEEKCGLPWAWRRKIFCQTIEAKEESMFL